MAFAGCCLAVLVLALSPQFRPPDGLDKAAHAMAFAVLAGLAYIGWPSRRAVWLCSLIAAGPVLDALQLFVPGRQGADLGDMAANVLGVVLGAVLLAGTDRLLRFQAARAEDPSR